MLLILYKFELDLQYQVAVWRKADRSWLIIDVVYVTGIDVCPSGVFWVQWVCVL